LEAGLRLSKVTALADDLAIALRVSCVRVVAPIPGKNTVGVEVPNERRVMVRLRELIESCPSELDDKRIPLFLGKDVSGHALVIDMAKMPHLLIAGRTGTGKSVCLNSLILSILMTRSPDEVKMLMIDPKMVELSPYRRVPHLMHPVITDMKKAEAVLAWAVDKMEERYDLLARCGVRHLDGFNQLHRDDVLERLEIEPDSEQAKSVPEKMPYIVIIADEMADMMMTSGKDVEGHIIRLAQKSRAVGIHLVLATQKPTVDVITGLIKSNLPARVSFQVASRTDSRVVLDEMGAERLLGNGDMLFLAPGTSHLTRSQGTFVSDEEVNQVIDFFRGHEPEYNHELSQLNTATSSGSVSSEGTRNRDALYDAAIEVVIREGRGSVSLLQRCLGIGYGRGARLIDYMAEDGIVGEYNGSQAREVLYTTEQWEEAQSGADAELVES
jgi:S-DNA-T family DNA segregation ATPase FtsK/SpoIIIE